MSRYSADPVRFSSVSLVTDSLGDNDPDLGDRCSFAGDEYLFVYNAGGEQADPGLAVTCSGVTGYSVTISTTVSALVALGVVKHATLTTATYGWVLTRGFATYEAGGTVAAGDGLSVAADGVFVITSGITGPVYGKAMVATGSGGSAAAYFSF